MNAAHCQTVSGWPSVYRLSLKRRKTRHSRPRWSQLSSMIQRMSTKLVKITKTYVQHSVCSSKRTTTWKRMSTTTHSTWRARRSLRQVLVRTELRLHPSKKNNNKNSSSSRPSSRQFATYHKSRWTNSNKTSCKQSAIRIFWNTARTFSLSICLTKRRWCTTQVCHRSDSQH